MKRLLWDEKARNDLVSIAKYFSDKDPRVAARLTERIEAAAAKLTTADTGRPGRMRGMREKSVLRTRYVLAYVVTEQEIKILRVIHSAQEWTRAKWPK